MKRNMEQKVRAVDFGDILEKWEKKNPKDEALSKAMNKDLLQSHEKNNAGERRSRLLRKKPDASIDLHGLKRDEAWISLETFFEDSKRKGYEKVLIIHGKGNHAGLSGGEGVLRDLARQFIESCSSAGESGYSNNRDGGRGSTWVILKGTD